MHQESSSKQSFKNVSKPIPKPRQIYLLNKPSDICEHHLIKMGYPMGRCHHDTKEHVSSRSITTTTTSNTATRFSTTDQESFNNKSVSPSDPSKIKLDNDRMPSAFCQEICVLAYSQENNQGNEANRDYGQAARRLAISCDLADSSESKSDSLNNTIKRISYIMNKRKRVPKKHTLFNFLSPPPGLSGSNVANYMRYLNTNVGNACDPLDPMNDHADRQSGLLVEVESVDDSLNKFKPSQYTKETCVMNMTTDIIIENIAYPIIDRAIECVDKRERLPSKRDRSYRERVSKCMSVENEPFVIDRQNQIHIENNLNKMDNKFSKNPFLKRIKDAVLNSQRGTIDIYIRGQEILMAGKGGYSLTRKLNEPTLYTDLEAKDFRLHNVNPSDNSVKVMPAPENSVFQVQYEKDKFMF